MGQEISAQEKFIGGLKESLRSRRVKVKKKDLVKFFNFLKDVCPWLPQEGTIDEKRWKRVGDALNDYYRTFGPDKVPITAFNYWNCINDLLCVHRHTPDVDQVLRESTSFLEKERQCNTPPLKPQPQKNPPSPCPTNEDSVSITMPLDEEAPQGPGASGPPPKSIYPSLRPLNSRASPPHDHLNPEEEAELDEEAAKYRNPDWPSVGFGPPSLPPPYHLQMPALMADPTPRHLFCLIR